MAKCSPHYRADYLGMGERFLGAFQFIQDTRIMEGERIPSNGVLRVWCAVLM